MAPALHRMDRQMTFALRFFAIRAAALAAYFFRWTVFFHQRARCMAGEPLLNSAELMGLDTSRKLLENKATAMYP